MLQHFLKSAWRNLLKNRLYAGINILGLAMGIAVAILILLYVQQELSYDRWIANKDRIFRVYRQWDNGGKVVWSPAPLARALVSDIPEVEQAAGLTEYGETLLDYKKNKIYAQRVAMADTTFFEVVNLPFLYGRRETALQRPNSVVLSKRIAEIFFGPTDPIGEVIRFNDEADYTVTGVLDRPPGNTHLDYEVYARIFWDVPVWGANNRATYVLARESVDVGQLEEKITALVTPLLEKEYLADNRVPKASDFPDWKLQPIDRIHLHSSELSWMTDTGGNIKYVYIFILIAVIVMLIASINYMNLSTAWATQRAKEVGVRKVSGARRQQLVSQFLSEAILQSGLAAIVALALAELFLPVFNRITDRELQFLGDHAGQMLIPLLGLTVLVGLLSGSYPAFVLSAFRPAKVLKGAADRRRGGPFFRRALVITQFSLTVVLIIIMTFIFKQVNFMLKQELGFAGDQVLVIPMNLDDSFRKVENLTNEFYAVPGIKSLATSSRVPGQRLPDWGVFIEGEHNDYDPFVMMAGEGFAETIGLEVVEGRFFSRNFPTDTLQAFVVNQAFVDQYQLKDPLGKKIQFTFEDQTGQIIGVINDFHYRGLDRPIKPLVMTARSNRWFTTVKLSTEDLNATIAGLRNVWEKVEAEHPMRYSFLDEDFARQYAEQERFGKALFYATLLSIFIAMMGLFGLASYAAARRTKEIGIRKVLGASVNQLVLMLIREFVRWVLVAGLIALPFGYLLSRRWLADFAYRTDISWAPFAGAIAAALIIATLTVSYQALRAALTNPVESLRYE